MVKASPSRSHIATGRCYDAQNCVTAEYTEKDATKNSLSHVRKLKERNELRALYKQLREVVPSCRSKPVTSLDIVLRAVDYINELHQLLGRDANESEEGRPTEPEALDKEDRRCQPASFHDITNVTSSTGIRVTPRIH